jgi:hypothetical protein
VKNTDPVRVTFQGFPALRYADGRIRPIVQGGSDPSTQVEEPPPGEEQEPPAVVEPPQPVIQIPKEKPTPQEQAQADLVFTKDDIEKARKEEKDKLYGRLQAMEAEIAETRKEREERLAAEEAARQEAEAAARRAAEEEMSAKELIEAKDREWSEKIARLEAEREEERRVFEMERQFQELERYRVQALAAAEDEIMPELRGPEDIRGNTPEEIDAAIALAKDKTARILANVQAVQQQARQAQRGVSVTAPPVGPMENDTNYQTLTADDIRNMDMDTYRQNREKILGALGHQTKNQGLYG